MAGNPKKRKARCSERCLTTRSSGGREAQFSSLLVRPFAAPLNAALGFKRRSVLMKRIILCCIFALLAISLAYGRTIIQIKEETIAGISVKVIAEYRSSLKTQFVELVIAEESYSKENLISIWRHYCEKYDKKAR